MTNNPHHQVNLNAACHVHVCHVHIMLITDTHSNFTALDEYLQCLVLTHLLVVFYSAAKGLSRRLSLEWSPGFAVA